MEINFTHHQSAHCENGVASNLLKNNGLNIYQAGKIASILSHDLKISKDDAIVHLLNLTSVIHVEQNEESILMEPQVSNAPFLRL